MLEAWELSANPNRSAEKLLLLQGQLRLTSRLGLLLVVAPYPNHLVLGEMTSRKRH